MPYKKEIRLSNASACVETRELVKPSGSFAGNLTDSTQNRLGGHAVSGTFVFRLGTREKKQYKQNGVQY